MEPDEQPHCHWCGETGGRMMLVLPEQQIDDPVVLCIDCYYALSFPEKEISDEQH